MLLVFLQFQGISLKLPIYDGTSEKNFREWCRDYGRNWRYYRRRNGKNPLIAGHSGLYKDNLFDDLPSVKENGKKFFIKCKW
ncbi:sortase [Enterococcus faecium]|nr:sortase [Enterococcus faecium]